MRKGIERKVRKAAVFAGTYEKGAKEYRLPAFNYTPDKDPTETNHQRALKQREVREKKNEVRN